MTSHCHVMTLHLYVMRRYKPQPEVDEEDERTIDACGDMYRGIRPTSGQIMCVLMMIMSTLIKAAEGVECYQCTYLPGKSDSQSSCSATWSWWRDAIPELAAPPSGDCQYSCLKVLVTSSDEREAVIRTCGYPCYSNQSLSHSTVTSCCDTHLCNHGNTIVTSSLVLFISAMTSFLGVLHTYW